MVKRLRILGLSLCIIISLSGCGGDTSGSASGNGGSGNGGGGRSAPKVDEEMQAKELGETFGSNDWQEILKNYANKRIRVTGEVEDVQGRKVIVKTGVKGVSGDEIMLTLELENSKAAARYPKGKFVAFDARVADVNAMGPILRGVFLIAVEDSK